MALSPGGFAATFRVLKNANYAYYAGGSFVWATGLWMQRIAVGWLTWELTHSGFWLGAIALADLFPSILLGPIAGVVADRFDRLRLMRLCQALSLAQAVTMVVLLILGAIDIWLILALVMFLGIVQAFAIGTQLSIVPSLVPLTMLPSAVALNSITFASARFVGPAIGGVVVDVIGVTAAVIATAIGYVVSLVCLARIVPIRSEHGGHKRHGMFGDIVDGLRYAVRHEGIAAMLIVMVVMSVGGRAVSEVLPKFTAVVFESDASGFATLLATMGGGAVMGGIWMSARGEAGGLTVTSILFTLLMASTIIALPFSGALMVASIVMAVFGFCMAVVNIADQTLIQLAVDGAMRGRVLSLYGMIFRGGPGIGALIIGYASDFVGINVPIVVTGMAMAAVGLWLWLRRDRIAAALDVRPHSGQAV